MRVLILSDAEASDLLDLLLEASHDHAGLARHYPDPIGERARLARASSLLFYRVNTMVSEYPHLGGGALSTLEGKMAREERRNFLEAFAALYREQTRPRTMADYREESS